MSKFLFFIVLLSLHAYGVEVTPTVRVHQSISFKDDMDFKNLELAIKRQLLSFERTGLGGEIRFGTKNYPRTVLKDSLILLRDLSNEAKDCLKVGNKKTCLLKFNQALNSKFAIYRPRPKATEPGFGSEKGTKFTSYYSPDLNGSRVRTNRFKNAIYRLPDSPHERNFTRVEIDYKGALAGKGYELFYVEDSFFDLYLLHVQGGGRINIFNPNGTKEVKYLSYAGKNARSFQMVYKYMLEKGYLKGDASVPAQRAFLQNNPDKEEEIFSSCPSYIYFRESDEEPVGVNNIPLTEGRSLAIDNTIYKTMGLINFVSTIRATHTDSNGRAVKAPFSRFFISQDTGGAIRGNARCDLYAGYGPLAELIAYNMNDMGEQYFLVKK